MIQILQQAASLLFIKPLYLFVNIVFDILDGKVANNMSYVEKHL